MVSKITKSCQGHPRIYFIVWVCRLHSPPCLVFKESRPKLTCCGKEPHSPTETAHKCFEFNQMIHVVIQEPESPFSEDLCVGPTGPGRDQLKQVCKLEGIYAVLLCIGPAGVMAWDHRPELLPVTAHHVFSLKMRERGICEKWWPLEEVTCLQATLNMALSQDSPGLEKYVLKKQRYNTNEKN